MNPITASVLDSIQDKSGLVVLAIGLGIKNVLKALMQCHAGSKDPVFVLNADLQMVEQVMMELDSEGYKLPQLVEKDYDKGGMARLYHLSISIGVFVVTSRVLVTDLLTNRVSDGKCGGILLFRPEKVAHDKNDALILQLCRDKHPNAFIQVFSDAADILMANNENKLSRIMGHLRVSDVHLFPRIEVGVVEALKERPGQLFKYDIPMSKSMTIIYKNAMALIRKLLVELRKFKEIDPTFLTTQVALLGYFDRRIKSDNAAICSKVKDISTLVHVIIRLLYDTCVDFWSFIEMLGKDVRPDWLTLTKEGLEMYDTSKSRVIRDKQPVLEVAPKWTVLLEVLAEINKWWSNRGVMRYGGVLVSVRSSRIARQLASMIAHGHATVLTGQLHDHFNKSGRPPLPYGHEVAGATLSEHIVVSDDAGPLLSTLRPSFVVLYDPDPSLVRQLEVHKLDNPGTTLGVYFLQYDQSIETVRWDAAFKREADAFEALIEQKSTYIPMPITARQPPTDKVIVDMREFRAALPYHLYDTGLLVVPLHLTIGDYVVADGICIERKSVPDFVESVKAGRLFGQVTNMGRFYERYCLLLEFDEDSGFSIKPGLSTGRIGLGGMFIRGDMMRNIALLVCQFPHLRVLWSVSPRFSAQLCKEIKAHAGDRSEPDAPHAVAAGTDMNEASDFLLQIPGISRRNIHAILSAHDVKNIRDLMKLSRDRLVEMLGDEQCVNLFSDFIGKTRI